MVRDIRWDQGQSHDSQEFFWWEGDTLVVNILGKPSAGRDQDISCRLSENRVRRRVGAESGLSK
ncbi:hypothetical protein C3R74_10450 [Acidithiobacillus ferridurans]|nr:hypothetical protein C3R74_10450 [Acidithiobacillus ferridurans]